MSDNKFLTEIERLRNSGAIDNDPSLIAFQIRDWDYTKAAGLDGICWAGCGLTGYIVRSEAIWLLDELEKFIKVDMDNCNKEECAREEANRALSNQVYYEDEQ